MATQIQHGRTWVEGDIFVLGDSRCPVTGWPLRELRRGMDFRGSRIVGRYFSLRQAHLSDLMPWQMRERLLILPWGSPGAQAGEDVTMATA